MKSGPRVAFAVVTACFLISGAAGLIYQVVWARYLALFLGHSSYAVVAVLVAFMGGLAIGNASFGRWADLSRRPLALYAWLELGIGIYAILFPNYYALCHDAFISLARSLRPGSGTLLALKFVFSLATVLLPTILMGATFPVLTRFVTRSLGELRERVAALYAINSAGAVAGCLIADFWWIPSHGLELTVYGAAVLNLLAGLVALVLSLRSELEVSVQPRSLPEAAPAEAARTRTESRLILAGIGLSGFVAMLYEVAWTRLLALALGSSTHAFSLMLITFITGIAVGAGIIYAWKTLRATLAAFGWAELALAAVLFVSLFYYQYLSFWFVKMAGLLNRREEAYPVYELVQISICFAVMFVPTICLGMTLPLASRIGTTEFSRTGRSVGTVFAINTAGTVLGTIVTGLWLMPALGLARTFAVGIALNAIIGIVALNATRLARRKAALAVPLLMGIGLVWFVGAKLNPAWQRAFSLGLWRAPNPPATRAAFDQTVAAMPLQFHRDGAGATVDVYSWKEDGEEHLTLKVNGKADASTQADMVTQILLGHLPMLLHPQARQALVIGLGSGMTCGAVAQHPSIERVDGVEISPEVVEGARFFAPFNNNVLASPKLHLAIEDAKSFLQITDRKYDLIVSEPSNPWMAGVAAVFTREYYETCAGRLQPDGLVAQWMHIYETTDETIELVLRTFGSVFPYFSIWQPALGDVILVGSARPIKVDLAAAEERFQCPAVKQDLARCDLDTLATVLAREMIPQQNGFFTVPPTGPVHSDYFPELEFLAQKGFFLNRIAMHWRRFREDFSPRASTLLGEHLRRHPLTGDDLQAFVRDFRRHRLPEPSRFRSLLHRWQADSSRIVFPIELWNEASEQVPAAEMRASQLAPLQAAMVEQSTSNPEPLRLYAADLMEAYRGQRSIFYLPPVTNLEGVLRRLIEVDPRRQRMYKLHLAELAWDRGDDTRCRELGEAAFDPDINKAGPIDFSQDPQAPGAVLYRMIETFWRNGNLPGAWGLCEQAKAGGYLENSDARYPLLLATYRRVEAHVGAGVK